jgi:hypothetical protein
MCGIRPELARQVLHSGFVAVDEHDSRTLANESLRSRSADAARRSGNDCNLVVQLRHGSSVVLMDSTRLCAMRYGPILSLCEKFRSIQNDAGQGRL